MLPRSFLDSASGELVTDTVWSVLLGVTWGTLASIPWSIACKAKLQSHELMLQQMASFECRAAECIMEAGRVLVEQQVQTLFKSPGTHEHLQACTVVPWASPTTSQVDSEHGSVTSGSAGCFQQLHSWSTSLCGHGKCRRQTACALPHLRCSCSAHGLLFCGRYSPMRRGLQIPLWAALA